MVICKNLEKRFGDHRAVDGVSLEIHPGECLGLLGPNGAGKSTLINLIYGAAPRSSGDIRVFGLDPSRDSRSIKKRLGVVTQENALDESLSVYENMLIYSIFQGLPLERRAEAVGAGLAYMSLDHKAGAPIQTLSGGMKRRLVFVRALLNDPELLILDEPTTGLDPAVRHLIWAKVKEMRSRGKTILLTTHYIHEAEVLCDRVAIMNKGRIVRVGRPAELIREIAPGFVGVFSEEAFSMEHLQRCCEGRASVSKNSSGLSLRTSSLESLLELQAELGPAAQMRPANLEDVFLKLTGEELTQND